MSTPQEPTGAMADHTLADPLDLGAEVAGAVIGAELAVLPSGATVNVNEGVMGALAAAVGDKDAGVGVTLDPSAWPIVHGSRGSEDRTEWRQPRGDPKQRFLLFSSQSVQEDEEANALYMGHMLVRLIE